VPQPEAAASRLAETSSGTPDRLAALRTFFVEMEPCLPAIAALTCDKIFTAKPEIASPRKGNIRDQQASFLAKLKGIARITRSNQFWPIGASSGPILIPQVTEFWRYHAEIGVTPENFALIKEMMMQACRETAPASFTQPVEEGLGFIFDMLAQSLTAANGPAGALSKPRLCRNGAALHEPAAYFDVEALAAAV